MECDMSINKMNSISFKFTLGIILYFPITSFAHLLSISGTAPFPSSVTAGKTANAIFTVTNIASHVNVTAIDKSVFPENSGLSVASSTCGSVLSPGASCTVTLHLQAPATAQTISSALQMWAKPSADGVQFPFSINIVAAPANHYAYIANSGNNTVSYCLINSDGSLSSCTSTGSNFSSPYGVAINPAGTYAYVANLTAPSLMNKAGVTAPANNLITYCRINQDGGLSSCIAMSTDIVGGPTSIAINPAGTYAYTTNLTVGMTTIPASAISYCPINSDGSFGTCSATGSAISGVPTGVAINASGTFAYVTVSSSNTVYRCPVNSNGSLGECSSTGSGLYEPYGITINSSGTFAYMADSSCYLAAYCTINQSDGSFSACQNTGFRAVTRCLVGILQPAGVAIYSNKNIAYFVQSTGTTATYCNLNSDGSLSSCKSTGGTFNAPSGIAID